MEELRQSFLDRPIRLRWLLYLILAFVVVVLILVGVQKLQVRAIRHSYTKDLHSEIASKGQAIAETIAVASRDDILHKRYDKLQDSFGTLVRDLDLNYLAVVTPDGKAVVHTNAKFRGLKPDDPAASAAAKAMELLVTDVPERNLYDVAVPVMSYTNKAAVVRVGVSYSKY